MASKEEGIKIIEESLSKCSIAIVTNYQGLSVAEMNQLRRKLRESSTEYRVVKNTMARFAAEHAGMEQLKEILQGPCGIAFGYGEPSVAAKVLTEFIQGSKTPLSIKGGVLEQRLLTASDVSFIANIPSREVLISKMMASVQMPIVSLVSVLGGTMRGLVQVLEARRQQLESQG